MHAVEILNSLESKLKKQGGDIGKKIKEMVEQVEIKFQTAHFGVFNIKSGNKKSTYIYM
ncbi:hypothetical protein [Halodesulfovibrio aestuarii]|uniref:Uncharacterized protein n=1 Tax=Halodesulfovibrio aestuarii TaxID=126333 RepID=A0ABV4JSX2_9BACT